MDSSGKSTYGRALRVYCRLNTLEESMKQTLKQKSKHAPAIARFGKFLYLAYTDTELGSNHLHVLQFTDGDDTHPREWDLKKSSIGGPSLAVFQDHLYIAWMGTGP